MCPDAENTTSAGVVGMPLRGQQDLMSSPPSLILISDSSIREVLGLDTFCGVVSGLRFLSCVVGQPVELSGT